MMIGKGPANANRQSIPNARLSVQLSELGPHTLARKRVLLLPTLVSKREDTLACGGGGEETQYNPSTSIC